MIYIYIYGDWGSELYATSPCKERAIAKAKAVSEKDPKNEYCVELEPGGFNNPLFKAGKKIA